MTSFDDDAEADQQGRKKGRRSLSGDHAVTRPTRSISTSAGQGHRNGQNAQHHHHHHHHQHSKAAGSSSGGRTLPRDAAKALREVEKKTSLLATASHEIRNPLTAVLGMAELLESADPKERQEYIEAIKQSGNFMLQVVNDVLDFSKADSGKMELNPEPFDVRSTIRILQLMLRTQLQEKGIRFESIIDPNIPQVVVGDVHKLKQIINNLVSNAKKFTPSGGSVTLSATLRQVEPAHNVCYIKFSVKDTGIGINKDKQVRIFERYAQADKSTSSKYGGTGLGLAISSSLARLMHGRLKVASEGEGHGSEFYFSARFTMVPGDDIKPGGVEGAAAGLNKLNIDDARSSTPAVEDDLTPDALPSQPNSAQQGPGHARLIAPVTAPLPSRRLPVRSVSDASASPVSSGASTPIGSGGLPTGYRILLAEDSIINQRLACRILSNLGHSVTVANNGQEAVELFKANVKIDAASQPEHISTLDELPAPFDMILMDLEMPELDGRAATRQIRQLEQDYVCKVAPIVAMTGHTLPTLLQECTRAGMNDVLCKPFSPDNLRAMVDRMLNSASSPIASSASGRSTTALERTKPLRPAAVVVDRMIGSPAASSSCSSSARHHHRVSTPVAPLRPDMSSPPVQDDVEFDANAENGSPPLAPDASPLPQRPRSGSVVVHADGALASSSRGRVQPCADAAAGPHSARAAHGGGAGGGGGGTMPTRPSSRAAGTSSAVQSASSSASSAAAMGACITNTVGSASRTASRAPAPLKLAIRNAAGQAAPQTTDGVNMTNRTTLALEADHSPCSARSRVELSVRPHRPGQGGDQEPSSAHTRRVELPVEPRSARVV